MPRPKQDTAYHHGALRDALLNAALEVVERQGADALSLRELAQTAGVSSAAPYRHFPDRAALLAAVAGAGYHDMGVRHATAVQGRAAPVLKLKRAMRAFFAFAQERPGLFRLMYAPPPNSGMATADPSVQALEAARYAEFMQTLAGALPALDERALRLRMVTLWATMLGHAMATLQHPLQPTMRQGLDDAEIEEAVIDAAIGTR